MKSKIFKYPLMLLLVSIATNCMAESGIKTEAGNIQTPEEFLQVVKNIVELDDLSDYQSVALKLRVGVIASPEEVVRSDSDQRILGRKIFLEFDPSKTKNHIFQRKITQGSIFFPDQKNFKRISFGFRIDTERTCIKKVLFYRTFNNRIDKSYPTDFFKVTDVSYFYRENKNNFMSVGADFDS